MDLFLIADIEQLKKDYGIAKFTLIDFYTGFDNCIYILFSNKTAQNINGMASNMDIKYMAFILMADWDTGQVINIESYDLGAYKSDYNYFRPFENRLLLLGARCRYYNSDNIEKNGLILQKDGTISQKLCFGDGIEDCITTSDGKIIISYFDEGILGNSDWINPIGKPGLIVWNGQGIALWKNTKYVICDCYAINVDSLDNLWFYYYRDFNLVCTNFKYDIVLKPDKRGIGAFALSQTCRHIIFSGGYGDNNSFYVADINIKDKKIGKAEKVYFKFENKSAKVEHIKFSGSKLLFLTENGELCGYNFADIK